jgi:hypothetical protein
MGRADQGLPPKVTDDQALDRAAALLAELVADLVRDGVQLDRAEDGAA